MRLAIALVVLVGLTIYALGAAFDALKATAESRIPVPYHQGVK